MPFRDLPAARGAVRCFDGYLYVMEGWQQGKTPTLGQVVVCSLPGSHTQSHLMKEMQSDMITKKKNSESQFTKTKTDTLTMITKTNMKIQTLALEEAAVNTVAKSMRNPTMMRVIITRIFHNKNS